MVTHANIWACQVLSTGPIKQTWLAQEHRLLECNVFCQTSTTEDQIYETEKFIGESNTADRWVSSCYDSWVLINMALEKLARSQENTRAIKSRYLEDSQLILGLCSQEYIIHAMFLK